MSDEDENTIPVDKLMSRHDKPRTFLTYHDEERERENKERLSRVNYRPPGFRSGSPSRIKRR